MAPKITPGILPKTSIHDSRDIHFFQNGFRLPKSIKIRSGSIIPIALPGSIIVARIAADTKAALDPKPPLLIPAKKVAKVAININSKLKYMYYILNKQVINS
tara:strand:- start:363 stop:668 length:306 start_codon:yes stop_codon:yes gene_type:complete